MPPSPKDKNQPHNQSQQMIQDLEDQLMGQQALHPPDFFHLGFPVGSLKEDEVVDVTQFEMNDDGSADVTLKGLHGKAETMHFSPNELGRMVDMVKTLAPLVGTKIMARNPARGHFFQIVQELASIQRSAMV